MAASLSLPLEHRPIVPPLLVVQLHTVVLLLLNLVKSLVWVVGLVILLAQFQLQVVASVAGLHYSILHNLGGSSAWHQHSLAMSEHELQASRQNT
jgi:hypothetical protein